jgi:hypothetical protein
MRALGRLLCHAWLALGSLGVLAVGALVVALLAYALHSAFLGRPAGPRPAVLIGILYVAACAGAVHIARRRNRGKTEEQVYAEAILRLERQLDPLLRPLARRQNRGWPWSSYGLGGGPDPEPPRPRPAPPAGSPGIQ